MLRHVGADYTLVYVGRSRERMAYVVELAELHGDRLVLRVDAEGSPLDVPELVRLGRRARTELYMCGPIRLMDAVRRSWQDAGLPPANLRYETFGSSGWFEPEEFVVRVPQRQVETTVRTDETLLEALDPRGHRPDVRLPQGRVRAVPPRRARRGRRPRPPRRLPQRRPAGQRRLAGDVRLARGHRPGIVRRAGRVADHPLTSGRAYEAGGMLLFSRSTSLPATARPLALKRQM